MLTELRNIIFYILFLIGFSWSVQSQNIVHFNGQNFEEYKLAVPARQMLVDSRGFLWIGTTNGIARFDGYDYIFYKENPLDSAGFQGQAVYDIFEDKEGGLWVGSDHGVDYLAPLEKTFVHYHFDVSRILSIVEDQSGTIWMTSPRTVIRIANGKIADTTSISKKLSEEGTYFYRLFVTQDQRILISGTGLYEIQVKEENEISVSMLIQGRYISNMTETGDGTLLMCSDSGYFVLRKGKQIVENKLDRENTRNGQLHLDQRGYLWFVHDWGIVRVRLDEDYKPVERNSYRTGYMQSISEDRSGNLFFGKGDGILKLGWNYNQFQFISLPDAFRNSYAFNFLEDDKGKLWIGTFDGLLVFDYAGRNYDVYKGNPTNLKTVPHSSIYGSMKDKSKALWFATGNGVVKYDINTKDFLRVSAGGVSHNLIDDNEGNIWFIAENRLFSIDPASLKAIQIESIDGVNISPEKIYQDRTNTFWIWDNKKGLLSYSLKNRVLNGDGQSALIEAGVKIPRQMKEDKMGQLWITFTHGVYIIDLQTRKIVRFMNTTNSPLLNDDAFGIACDQSGNIWLKQHPYGSICINPKTFDVIGYNPNWLYSGLFGEMGRQPASVVAAGEDGKLFADGHGDFCIFYPDSLRINKFPPSLVLQEFRVNEQLIEDRSTFQSFENNIDLVFCGIHFDNPNRNHYAYFLEGYDHVWSTPSKIKEARYSNLPSGTFKFFLKAANSDGVWSEPTLLSTFTILPVWWQTKIAFATYLILLLGLIVMFYRIKLAQRLAQAETQKLKEIDDFKNQFFTNITHEFRTPLTVITGVAEKIEGKSGVLIKRNAEQLLTLINQILELSKIEANASKLNPEPVEMHQFLKYLLQSFSSLVDEKSIVLNFESEINQLYTVIDKNKFTLIIQNLLINAVKFTPPNGSITVAISSNSDHFQIQIRDTGIGIDATELPFIFNRFYQANNQQEDIKGSGIGLAITKELVELMKGEISVMSEKGNGTIFKIILPVHQPAKMNLQVMDEPEERSIEKTEEKLNILLIEDNEDVATLIQDILSEQFDVVRTVNGKVGVDKAIEYIPDLIISDVMMPEMNGLEVTQHLKADLRTSHIPIILLTAKADLDSRLSGLSQGADIYLVKPFHSEELLLHIQNLVRLREALRQRYSEEPFVIKENTHPEDAFVAKLQASLYAHLADDTFGIEEICREMGVSRTQLHRKLKALTGKSASLYIRDLRLAEGKKLLLQNTSTIAGVAYAIGFSDPNYFSRLYSEKYGYPPTEERKN